MGQYVDPWPEIPGDAALAHPLQAIGVGASEGTMPAQRLLPTPSSHLRGLNSLHLFLPLPLLMLGILRAYYIDIPFPSDTL